jgi:hypothetical protein
LQLRKLQARGIWNTVRDIFVRGVEKERLLQPTITTIQEGKAVGKPSITADLESFLKSLPPKAPKTVRVIHGGTSRSSELVRKSGLYFYDGVEDTANVITGNMKSDIGHIAPYTTGKRRNTLSVFDIPIKDFERYSRNSKLAKSARQLSEIEAIKAAEKGMGKGEFGSDTYFDAVSNDYVDSLLIGTVPKDYLIGQANIERGRYLWQSVVEAVESTNTKVRLQAVERIAPDLVDETKAMITLEDKIADAHRRVAVAGRVGSEEARQAGARLGQLSRAYIQSYVPLRQRIMERALVMSVARQRIPPRLNEKERLVAYRNLLEGVYRPGRIIGERLVTSDRLRVPPVERLRVPPPERLRVPTSERIRIPPPERLRVPPPKRIPVPRIRIPPPERIRIPVKITTIRIRGKGKEKEVVAGKGLAPVIWKQGFGWWVIDPPYKARSDAHFERKPPRGAIIASGIGSAYKTILALGGAPNFLFSLDLGIIRVQVVNPTNVAGQAGTLRFVRKQSSERREVRRPKKEPSLVTI